MHLKYQDVTGLLDAVMKSPCANNHLVNFIDPTPLNIKLFQIVKLKGFTTS